MPRGSDDLFKRQPSREPSWDDMDRRYPGAKKMVSKPASPKSFKGKPYQNPNPEMIARNMKLRFVEKDIERVVAGETVKVPGRVLQQRVVDYNVRPPLEHWVDVPYVGRVEEDEAASG